MHMCRYVKGEKDSPKPYPCSLVYPVLSVLRFALIIIHGCGRAVKNGEGLVSFMT